jgi:pilus assembly protein Flp/PilA
MTKLYATLLSFVAAPKKDEKGATAVEYALVIGLVSLVVVAAVAAFGPKITAFITGLSFT